MISTPFGLLVFCLFHWVLFERLNVSLWCTGSVVVACGLSCPMACEILVAWPKIEPTSPALDRFLTTGPQGSLFSSVIQSCPTLCDPMDCRMPGFSVLHYLWVCSNLCPLSQWCHPTVSSSVVPFCSFLQSFPASGCFPMSQFLASGGQRTGVSASAPVLPMTIQDCFPSEWTGWISLQS